MPRLWEGQEGMNGIAKVGNTHPRYKEGIRYLIIKEENGISGISAEGGY